MSTQEEDSKSQSSIHTATYLHAVSENETHAVPYLLYYPPKAKKTKAVVAESEYRKEKIPLILFLHGQSGRGDDIMQVAAMAFPELCFQQDTTPITITRSPPTTSCDSSPDTTSTINIINTHIPPYPSSDSEHVPIPTATTTATTAPQPLQYIYTGQSKPKPSSCLPICEQNLPAMILCPQCPRGTEWKKRPLFEAVMALLDMILDLHTHHTEGKVDNDVQTRIPPEFLSFYSNNNNNVNEYYEIDESKVYVTGMSMGGLGAWMFAARYPDRFTAVVPICGGGPPLYAPILKDKPIWFFHSQDDNVIGVEETDRIVEALQQCGSMVVNYTRYEQSNTEPASATWMVGHNCWSKAYASPDLWEWLFNQYL